MYPRCCLSTPRTCFCLGHTICVDVTLIPVKEYISITNSFQQNNECSKLDLTFISKSYIYWMYMDSFLTITGSKNIGFNLLTFYFSPITVSSDFFLELSVDEYT